MTFTSFPRKSSNPRSDGAGSFCISASIVDLSRQIVNNRVEFSGQTDKLTSKHYDKLVPLPADKQTTVPTEPPTSGQADILTVNTATKQSAEKPNRTRPRHELLEARIRKAKELTVGSRGTVTLRISAKMNDWLDEYVHELWRLKVRKQELVAEALRMLYARRGLPGEPIIKTELLPDESET